MKNIRPHIEVNASSIDYKKIGTRNFGMLRLDDCFDQYLYGPEFIDLLYSQDADRIRLDEIFKVVFGGNDYSSCYGIFADDEHDQNDMAIYQIEWNRKADLEALKSDYINKYKMAYIPDLYPELDIKITVLRDINDIDLLAQKIKKIDCILDSGIKISANNIKNDGSYKYLLRRYYWGKVEISWSRNRQSMEVENEMDEFREIIARIAHKNHTEVNKCIIGYSDRMGL